jgi:hypothetical protein
MRQTTISGHPNTHHPIGEMVLLLAGIIVLIAFGDAFALVIAAAVIATLVWGMIREIEHRVRNRRELAPVTQLRPALAGQRDLKKTAAHASRRGPSAA